MRALKVKRSRPLCSELAECGEQIIEEAEEVLVWVGIEAIDDDDIVMISSEFHESNEIARAISLLEKEELTEDNRDETIVHSTGICKAIDTESVPVVLRVDGLPNISLMEDLEGVF